METTRLRRVRIVGVLVATALVLGLVYGLLMVALGEPSALFTWWGTCLRGLLVVSLCLLIAGAIDRRWSRRADRAGRS